jgi:hypothetical protein
MKRYSFKLPLCQPAGISTAKAIGLIKEQLGIFFDFYEKELAAHDYPPALTFNIDGNGLTVVQKKQPKILALKAKVRLAL